MIFKLTSLKNENSQNLILLMYFFAFNQFGPQSDFIWAAKCTGQASTLYPATFSPFRINKDTFRSKKQAQDPIH